VLWPLKALKSRSLGVPPVLDAILGPVRWDGRGWDGMRCTVYCWGSPHGTEWLSSVGQLHAISKGIHSEGRLWLNLILNPGEPKVLRLH